MNAFLLFATAIALGDPGPKDPPMKPEPLVGVWTLDSIAFGGKVHPDPDRMRWQFTAEGKYIKHWADKKHEARYSINPKADPRAIDLKLRPDVPDFPNIEGIFKVDGDTLTVALPQDGRTVRPTDFEVPKDSKIAVYVFKRIKPND